VFTANDLIRRKSQIMKDGSEASSQTDAIDNLLAIFAIDTLRDLKKHCLRSIIGESDLANLIMWCRSADAPFLHATHHRHFVPEHLNLSDSDLAALAGNGVGPRIPKSLQPNPRKLPFSEDTPWRRKE
jgi:hypothetical protein